MTLVSILFTLFIGVLIYLALLMVWYTVLLVTSFPGVIKKCKESIYGNIHQLIDREHLLPITIVIPVLNEEKHIINTIMSVFNSHYKNVTLIIVNDGSTDGSMALLKKEFFLYEVPLVIKQQIPTSLINHCYNSLTHTNLTVIDKQRSPYQSAADAVNAGLNACKTPLMIKIDAGMVLESETISRILFTFLSKSHCIAVSGVTYVLNDNLVEQGKIESTNLPKHFIPGMQSLEYLASFIYRRSLLGGALRLPSAFTLFETDILRDVGGFDTQNVAYDAEIMIKLHHHMRKNNYPYTMPHSADAFCWATTPSTLKQYGKQRIRWQQGLWRSVFNHLGLLFNPRYGRVGLFTFPGFVLFDVLGPVIESMAWVLLIVAFCMGLLNTQYVLWFFLLGLSCFTFMTTAIIFLNRVCFNKFTKKGDAFKAQGWVFVEMFGFRQYRAVCGLVATFKSATNKMLGKSL